MLSERFFRDNPIKELTEQQFVYVQIQTPKLAETASEFVRAHDNRADEERENLLHENDFDILLKMLRGKCDGLSFDILYQRILEHKETLVPRMLEMFKTSLNDIFIENTVKILIQTQKDYSEVLLKTLDEIRSPYALYLACITLGFIAVEDAIPVLIKKFNEFKSLYPDENYEQGPLYGLIKLNERF